MDINPIPYKAFISEDDSIQKLINLLEDLQKKYLSVLKTVSQDATSVKASLQTVSAATAEGREEISKTTVATEKLKRLQDEFKVAMSSTGVEIARVKAQLAEVNKENTLFVKMTESQKTSIQAMKNELAVLIDTYEKLTLAERLNEEQSGALVARILQLKTQLAEAAATIKISTSAKLQEAKTSSDLDKAIAKLTKAYADETMELIKIKRETDEVLKIKRLEAQVNDSTIDSYNRLAAQYELSKITLNKYSQEVINQSRFLSALQKDAAAIRLEMVRLQEATGNHALSVGNYTKAWNGFGVSVQQVLRELPTLAVSAQTFFLAISNNLPILGDEIANLTRQNKLAAEQGKATTSVFRQLVKSLMSWQTALVLGVTILSLYGGKIVKFIEQTFKAQGAAESFATSQEKVNKSLRDSDNEFSKGIITFRILQTQWLALGDTARERQRFIDENKDAFRDMGVYINNVNEAESIFVQNSAQFIKVLELRAKAAAARELAEEQFKKEFERAEKQREQLEKAAIEAEKLQDLIARGLYVGPVDSTRIFGLDSTTVVQTTEAIEALMEGMSETQRKAYLDQSKSVFQRQGEQYVSIMTETLNEAYRLSEEYGFKIKKDEKTPKGPSDLSIENENLKIQKRFAESVTNLERDELEKQRKQLRDKFAADTADLRNKQKNDKRLTEESRELIDQIILNNEETLKYNLEILEIEWQQRQLNLEKETLDLRLSLAEVGTTEYYDLRNQMLRNQMQYELLENRKHIEALRQDESSITSKYDKDIIRNEVALDDILFDIQQKYQESEFNLVQRSEYEKNKFRLEQERDRWQRTLEMAKGGLLELSALEIAAIENTLSIIDRQLKENMGDRDIYDFLGISLSNKQKRAISEATAFVKEQITEILDKELELAEKKLEKAQEQTSRARDFLRLEMEARNEGYAHNVETANKELLLAQENEQKALVQKQQAAAARERIETLSQATSLITASANIWSTFSTMGPFGIPAAIAAIALMFGSFITAKARARQLSSSTELYEHGHAEILEGGSHASGKDIPLGKTKDGKERRAEGGEILAVINKKSTQKYGADNIIGMVDNLNKGIFEDKYLNIFNPKVYHASTAVIDISGISSDVKAIRNNSEYKYFINNGLLTEKYKNRTRVYRHG